MLRPRITPGESAKASAGHLPRLRKATDPTPTPFWVLALVFVVAWAFRVLSTTNLTNDHFMHLAWANQLLAGELPIRDFVDPGMPLTYLTSAAAQVLLGRGVWADVVLNAGLLALGAALTCYLAARPSGLLAVGLLAAAVQVVIAPRLYSAPKIGLHLWALWAFWRYADKPTNGRLAGIVACTVVAFLFRHDHGLYIAMAAMVLLIAMHWRTGLLRPAAYAGLVTLALLPFAAYVQANGGVISYLKTGREFARAEYAGQTIQQPPRFDLSLRTPDAPEVNVRWAQSVDDAIRADLETQHQLVNAAWVGERTWRYSLLDQSRTNVLELVNQPEVEDTEGINRGASSVLGVDNTIFARMNAAANRRGADWVTAFLKRQNAVRWMYELLTWAPIIVLILVAVPRLHLQWWDDDRLTRPVAAAAALLAVVTTAGFLRDQLDVRLADASAVPLVLAAWLAGQLWRAIISPATPTRDPQSVTTRRPLKIAAIVTIILAGSATFLSAAELGGLLRNLDKIRIGDGPRAMAREALDTVQTLKKWPPTHGWLVEGDDRHELKLLTRYVRECTAPDDRLLVTWFAPEVYFFSERRFAAGLAFLYPGFFSTATEEQVALARLHTQRVPVVLTKGAADSELVVDHPLLAAELAERYVVAGEIVTRDDHYYRVLTDRSAVPVRTVPPWNLPCFQ